MLHNNQPTTTPAAAATTTDGHGTEPTIETHLAAKSSAAAAAASPKEIEATSPPIVDEGQSLTAAAGTTASLSAVGEQTETADVVVAAVAAAAASESPAFDSQMRTQQRQKIKIYHDARQTAVWRTDSLASNPNSTMCPDFGSSGGSVAGGGTGTGGLGVRSIILSTAPSLLQRKASDTSLTSSIPRRVSFPENQLVTGYLEPADPWKQVCLVQSIAEIVDQYVDSCRKHKTEPLKSVMDHLKNLDLNQVRQPLLPLKANQLAANDCEALEEIFKRIQYKCIDLSDCSLDESCLMALFQMIEYYEAANELDISYNKEQMTKRCWELCAYMVERSQELQLLNAESNQITKLGADSLGRALGSSNLHTLKLEHCGLRGQPLVHLLSFAGRGLYQNKMLKELWVGYNDLDCVDAQHIADMLRYNHSLELIDISNNNIRNEGVMYLVQALILQSTELERRMGALKRTRAIEVDECSSPVDLEPPTAAAAAAVAAGPQSVSSAGSQATNDVVDSESSSSSSSVASIPEAPAEEAVVTNLDQPAVGVLIDVENDNDDDNTEDTVRTVKNCGQSMLDKLLSMNSDSSSEEAPSNISTDTLAACCSEDISEISNEIYEVTSPKQAVAEAGPEGQESSNSGPAESQPAPSAAEAQQPVAVPEEEPLSPTHQHQHQHQQQQQQQQSSQNERNICDITPSTEAKTVKPNESCVQNNIINNNNNNQANNAHNTYNNNIIQSQPSAAGAGATATVAVALTQPTEVVVSPNSSSPAAIFEVTAEESDCINGSVACGAGGSRPLDVNQNARTPGDDFEDTHSTDSAFESASEGDISRHLPDEFSRLSVSLESTRLDDMAKEMGGIETATIATESTECLFVAQEATMPTPAAPVLAKSQDDAFLPPKVTIAEECLQATRELSPSSYPCPSPVPTPPPPSTSPGGASIGLRRTESSCAYLNQSSRNRSQSSDSLCSETSLDGSNSNNSISSNTSNTSNDPKFAEKLTKNDTLSRRQLAEATLEAANRSPSGLKALTLWNNNLTKDCATAVAELLQKTISLELLNIGKNCLSNEFVATIKESLTKNTTLTTLGLQSAHLSARGVETLATILTFGGNSKLQRIDIRDNKLEVESLNIIAEVLKSNNTLTQIDINDEPKRLTLPIVPIVNVIPPSPLPQESIGSDAHLDYTRVLGTVRSLCSRNEKRQAQELAERTVNAGGSGSNTSGGGSFPGGSRCRGGYYLGSRKISLTCHSRPFVDAVTGTVTANATATVAATALPTPAALLEVKRKGGSRLRSPGPSPPTISPSSSPNRSSRFHVSRVTEVASSPLISPLAQHPPQHTPRSASSCMSIPTISSPGGSQSSLNTLGALPTSSSLPAMASVTCSTQTVKRLSVSPRSRFHVSRIYEDPQVPLANRQLPPITPHTPPIDLPPTPMLKSARKAVQLSEAAEAAAAAAASAVSSVMIIEPSDNTSAEGNDSTNDDDRQKLSPHETNSPTVSNSSPGSNSSSSNSSGSGSGCSSSTTNDATDSVDSSAEAAPPPRTCPLAVFGDNDITLTKESAGVVALSAAAAAAMNPVLESETEAMPPAEPVSNNPPQTRARKTSWIANPSAVDKLLTIFQTGTIFQRSSSPESKVSQVTAITTATTTATSVGGGVGGLGGGGGGGTVGGGDCSFTNATPNPILSVARKNSPASWTSLTGSNISNSSQNVDSGSSSFLDTASRQLRDFSKQVFRQNISFNNSSGGGGDASVSGGGSSAAQLEGTTTTATSSSSSTESASSPECNAAHMLPSLKRQLKENISPEHTINEETLHSLQKLSRAEDMTLKAEAASELGDIEIVMHSEVVDCPLTEEKSQDHEETAPSLV